MKLREYLKKNRISSREFANRLGVHEVHVSRVMNGHNKPSKHLAVSMSRETGGLISWMDIMSGKASDPFVPKKDREKQVYKKGVSLL